MASKFAQKGSFFAGEHADAEARQDKAVDAGERRGRHVGEQAAIKRGRPVSGSAPDREGLIQISAYVPASMRKRLKVYSASIDVPVSEIMRRLLERELEENGY